MFNASAERVARRCIEVGREFWAIDSNLDIRLRLERIDEDDAPAKCNIQNDYHRAWITLDPGQCKSLEEVWDYTAHEVAHVVLAEMELYFDVTGEAVRNSEALGRIMRHAVERTVSQLERVFLRCNPYAEEEDEVVT